MSAGVNGDSQSGADLIMEFSSLAKEIQLENLKIQVKDLKAQIYDAERVLDEVREMSAVSVKRGGLVKEIQKSLSSRVTTEEIHGLKREIQALEHECAQRSYVEIEGPKGYRKLKVSREQIQVTMAKCTELEENLDTKKNELSYSFKLPPNLSETKAVIELRKEYLKQLENRIDMKLSSQNNKVDGKNGRKSLQ